MVLSITPGRWGCGWTRHAEHTDERRVRERKTASKHSPSTRSRKADKSADKPGSGTCTRSDSPPDCTDREPRRHPKTKLSRNAGRQHRGAESMSGRAASLSWSIERPRSQDLAKSDGERRSVAGVGGARRDGAAAGGGATEADEANAGGDEGREGAETREGYGGGGGGQGADGAGVDVSGQNIATLELCVDNPCGGGVGGHTARGTYRNTARGRTPPKQSELQARSSQGNSGWHTIVVK